MPTLPNSVETEMALLGSLIVYPDKMSEVFDSGLEASDFYLKSHQLTFVVLKELYDENIPIDYTSVVTRLNDKHQLEEIGGADYISKMADLTYSSYNVNHYIKIIQDKSNLRKLTKSCEDIIQKCYQDSGNYEMLVAEAESSIMSIANNVKTSDVVDSQTAMTMALKELKDLQSRKGLNGVPSGYKALDNITNGFQKGDLIILAARPSVGKTAFALNIALNAAIQYKKAVAIFSLEMPVLSLSKRMLSKEAQINGNALNSARSLTDNDFGKLNNAAEKISLARIYIDDSPSIKMNEIYAKCRKLKNEGNLDLVIVDYLQLIAPSTNRNADNRQLEVSEISRRLKALAREMEVPVIALSQLSRLVEQRKGDNEPKLSDLRESGAIEQDADVVLFLYRNKSKNDKGEEDEDEQTQRNDPNAVYVSHLSIAKHRNGQTGDITLMFQPGLNSFYNQEYRDE